MEKSKKIEELAQNGGEACHVIFNLLTPMFIEGQFDTADIFSGLVFATTALAEQITIPDENGSKRKRIEWVVNNLISAALNDLDVK